MTNVAIIGCGISGISAAISCLEHQLQITVFERRTKPGGIWSKQHTPVFENLTTNTAVFEMFFSHILPPRITSDHSDPNQDLCFSTNEMYNYLCRVVEHTGVLRHVSFATTVTCVDTVAGSSPTKFVVHYDSAEHNAQQQVFDHVIVASGNFDTPFIPPSSQMPGISSFKSQYFHVSSYNRPSQLRGKKVLMVGGSHSALEAVADMLSAPDGEAPSSVTIATRTMRQILVKQRNARMLCSQYSTRYDLLRMLAGRLSPEQLFREMHMFFVNHHEIHAPAPNVPLVVPPFLGVSVVNATFVDAIKRGRSLQWKVGGVKQVTENGAVFADGTSEDFDAIVYATGYKVHAPCLSSNMQQIITPEDGANMLELYDFTFHPDLKGVSFVGFMPPGTSSIPMYENQARWIASTISGQVPMVDDLVMRKKIEENKILRKQHKYVELTLGFEVLDLFAKHGGFEVDLFQYPSLSKAMLLGPLCPSQFRMFGNGKRDDCREMFERQIEAGGYHVGDASVEKEVLDELKIVTDVLEKKGIAPKGLRGAVEYLRAAS